MNLKSFGTVQDFIKELFGCDFLGDPVDARIEKISELMTARWAIEQAIRKEKKSFDQEFINYVFPILEVALQWIELKKSSTLSKDSIAKFKKRMTNSASSNFLGAIFEIDMATRCLLSGWKSEFAEAYFSGKDKKIDLLVVNTTGATMGLECTSKRAAKDISVVDINETIDNKSEKFRPEYLTYLPMELNLKIVILDITRGNYEKPAVLKDLSNITIPDSLDGVVLTWREDLVNRERHSLRIKYESLGNVNRKYFTTTWAAEFHPPTQERSAVFFLRKYVEPEPQHGKWGPEETRQG